MNPFCDLTGKSGLVLGVANDHSIAAAVTKTLHRLGAKVQASCLNDKARPFASAVTEPLGIPLVNCDLTKPGELEAFVQHAVDAFGTLDFVIHSLAWAPLAELQGRVTDTSREGFANAMSISCHSFAEVARLVAPHMPSGGSLVTMTYHGADEVVPNYGLMGPVKAALESMVRYVANELGGQNIRVHAVSPGPVPTRAASGIASFDKLMQDAIDRSPLKRLVTIEEIANLTAFLCANESAGMTGQTIYVDAGYNFIA
jgi:enoyl-[acyl-carrier protein] reductase I